MEKKQMRKFEQERMSEERTSPKAKETDVRGQS
jgi:hypothetical protein